jgi:hypothetical protein
LKGWEKRARQLILNPAGRDALRELGIDVEIASNGHKPEEKPIVAILCPSYRAPEPQMQNALGDMIRFSAEKAYVYSCPSKGNSVVHWARNNLIIDHLKSGKPWTHVLFIDDDIIVQPDTLVKLLSHKKDIVAGLCTHRQDPPLPNIRLYDEESGKYSQIFDWPQNELIGDHKRLAVGTGLMLISKHALEQVAQAYFDCLWEQETYGLAGEKLEAIKAMRLDAFDKDKVCFWFRFLQAPKAPVEMGEDVSFCHIATRYCDIPVYVDTSITPGHIGLYDFSIKDFLPYRDECILRAKVNGQYKLEVPDMKISILCPTRGRPENVNRLMASLEATSAAMPEVVFYIDDDDAVPGILPGCKIIRGPRIKMSQMWNKCAEAASGEILMIGADDIVFRTKGWDDDVRRAFAAFPDRLVFVHGNDGHWGAEFGTHGFLHRNWADIVGYFVPPYFSADFVDTWWNEVANALNRRIYLPFVTEHMHPLFKKAQWDKTHQDKGGSEKTTNSAKLYDELRAERKVDCKKLAEAIDRKSYVGAMA